jgi:hypothetical protein
MIKIAFFLAKKFIFLFRFEYEIEQKLELWIGTASARFGFGFRMNSMILSCQACQLPRAGIVRTCELKRKVKGCWLGWLGGVGESSSPWPQMVFLTIAASASGSVLLVEGPCRQGLAGPALQLQQADQAMWSS